VLDLANDFPAFIGSILTSKGVPISQVFKSAAKSAFGWFVGGAATDVVSRKISGQEVA
jgi:hypothetical protein